MTELKVLILDDNNLTARAIANVAEFIGLSAKITSDFQSFLEIINDWSPQYLIIDLIMPDMDGVEVLGELGRMQIDAQLIITSGAGQQLLHAAARSAGAHGLNVLGVLPKPFNPKAFRDLINSESINTADNKFGQQLRAENQANTLTVNELEEAINAGEIYLVYQPKVSCISGTLTGLEALARWQHAEKGFISPEKFIPLAEQNDLIDKLTLQVFEQALPFLNYLQEADPSLKIQNRGLLLSVNISAASLKNLDLFKQIEMLCEAHNIKPDQLILELTETAAMDDPVMSLDILTRLRLRGFRLSIDDFGTGFSSMLALVRMPFSEVKVDKTFVMTSADSRESRLVIKAIIELAHSLNMQVAAEGIEDNAALDLLRKMGCDQAQGYFIGRPMLPEAFIDWSKNTSKHIDLQRLKRLHGLGLLDSEPEHRYDRLTKLCTRLFDVEISLISLIDEDRQWIKSSQGFSQRQTERSVAFCNQTIAQEDIFVISDTLNDKHYAENNMVTSAPYIRFYAGCPIRASSGEKLGALCLKHPSPRSFSDRDKQLLKQLTEMVEEEIDYNPLLDEDNLTGLMNREAFERRAQKLLNIFVPYQASITMYYFDVNNYKRISHAHGISAGDEALIHFSRILTEIFTDTELVSRLVDDEFVVLSVCEQSENRLEQLAEAVKNYNANVSPHLNIEYTVGTASSRLMDNIDLQSLYMYADTDLYEHKSH